MQTKYQILKQTFGYDNFLTGQENLIDSALEGHDTLGIMPTGAGKSICFQIPALMSPGITLIISPLISLMKDQVNALTQVGVKAAFINSSLTERQILLALEGARNGLYKIIYIAPERLLTTAFLDFAKNANISMITVDEAHCISQWGQDFRPSYAKIPEFISELDSRPIISAFTATATPKVREDIVQILKLRDPTVLITGFDRPNLYFELQTPKDKFKFVSLYLADKNDRTGIIYCSTRATVEEVCDRLNSSGFCASRYHAGLSDIERHQNQDDFLYDRVKIMVATNAFGMGIDKSNVSFVIHYNMPKDVESYYQEAGRAGRDGQSADCILLYSGRDVRTNLWLIENARDREYIDHETETLLKERERKRLREMTFYCTTTACLRGYMLRYFGETPPNYCGNCGNCNTNFESIDITIDAQKILSCVSRVKEKYGAKMIIDILRGSKNERLIDLKLNELSTYGISKKSDRRLWAIIDYLVQNNFLIKTDDEFPTLKLGAMAHEVLHDRIPLEMKVSNEKEPVSLSRAAKSTPIPGHVNDKLFNMLKDLRLEIAGDQQVPSYVVFSDSSLIDMCIKRPIDEDSFLRVSGVGQTKLQRYGKRFIDLISDFIGSNKDVSSDSLESDQTLPEIMPSVETSEKEVSIRVIADRINCIRLRRGLSKVSGQKLNDILLHRGYLAVQTIENGKSFKSATPIGEQIGIHSERHIVRGEECIVNLYSLSAQKMVIEQVEGVSS